MPRSSLLAERLASTEFESIRRGLDWLARGLDSDERRDLLSELGLAVEAESASLRRDLAAAWERERALVEGLRPFTDERRIVAPSADPNTDPAVVVTLAELDRARRLLASPPPESPRCPVCERPITPRGACAMGACPQLEAAEPQEREPSDGELLKAAEDGRWTITPPDEFEPVWVIEDNEANRDLACADRLADALRAALRAQRDREGESS